MIAVLLAIHILIAISLVGVVLMQKSEGGALGSIGGGGMSGFMTGRSTANLLTRATAILFAVFVATSIALVYFSSRVQAPSSIIGHEMPKEAVPPLPSPALPVSPPVRPPVAGAAVPAPHVPMPAQPSKQPPGAAKAQQTMPTSSAKPAAPQSSPQTPPSPATPSQATPATPNAH